jgi:carbamoyltransferase
MGQPNPFMTMAADVRPEAKSRIPAVVHADGSARPQVVFPEHNPAYGRLLESFNQLTGVPVLVNTSLNLKGTPIANSPGDVLDLFLATDIEAAVISSYLIYRE